MGFSDNYAVISGSGWDCEATTAWSTTGSVPVVALTANNVDQQQGTNSIEITADAAGVAVIFNNNLTNFRIDQTNVHFWFKYAKGKSPPYLTSTNTAIRVRAYTAVPGSYFEYWLTELGDEELLNGWQVFQFSGSNADATVGTPSVTSNIVRLELRLDFANPNNGTDDNPLRIDCWFEGTTIELDTEGTLVTPASAADIANYSDTTRAAFPLGLVEVSPGFVNLRCGLTIGAGVGTSVFKELSRFILFNQFSNEVKHELKITGNGTMLLGEQDNGNPVRGCQLVLPTGRLSDLIVEDGGTFRAFGSKIFQFRDVFFGAAGDLSSDVELRTVDIGSCETVYFRANTLNIENVQVHDNDNNNRDWASEISVSPDSCSELLVYSNVVGAKITSNVVIEELLLQDNTNDLQILDPATLTIRNGNYDPAKVSRVTS